MAFEDFFSFDEGEYFHRISRYDTGHLRKQEVVKTRQQIGAGATIGTSIGAAVFTCGATLAVTAYGCRRLDVAERKLAIIQQVLTSRNVKLHEFQKRDFLIPMAASLVGVGIGFGVSAMAIECTTTNAVEVQVEAAHPDVSTGDLAPAAFAQGAQEGFVEQVREMGNALLDPGAAAAHSLDTGTLPLSMDEASVSQAVGYHDGMVLAQQAEKAVAGFAASLAAEAVLTSVLDKPAARTAYPQ